MIQPFFLFSAHSRLRNACRSYPPLLSASVKNIVLIQRKQNSAPFTQKHAHLFHFIVVLLLADLQRTPYPSLFRPQRPAPDGICRKLPESVHTYYIIIRTTKKFPVPTPATASCTVRSDGKGRVRRIRRDCSIGPEIEIESQGHTGYGAEWPYRSDREDNGRRKNIAKLYAACNPTFRKRQK